MGVFNIGVGSEPIRFGFLDKNTALIRGSARQFGENLMSRGHAPRPGVISLTLIGHGNDFGESLMGNIPQTCATAVNSGKL